MIAKEDFVCDLIYSCECYAKTDVSYKY